MKILVVEDDELIAQTLSAILSMYHYAVEVVHDGVSALDILEAFDFDVVLLDILLPKLNGLEVCKQARAKGLQIPILMLTARDSTQDKAAGLDAGADDYLVKPFDPEELIARVRALLRRGRITQSTTLGVGQLTLDPESCEVRYAGEVIPLTPKEYALLELFLRNPKRVYSCGMILEHLWTHDDTPGEEAVRTHIKGLRHKLKQSGAGSDLIATVYGIGYRLKPQPDPVDATMPESNTASDEIVQESDDTSQILAQKIEKLWKNHQDAILDQVSLLEVAVQAAARHTLSSQSRTTAIKNAHSLAGTLGTFGAHSGSEIARSIELILMPEHRLTDVDIKQLHQWIQDLKRVIQEKSTTLKSLKTSSLPVENTILSFLKDHQLTATLTRLAQQIGYSVQSSTSLKNARTLVENIRPVGIFWDPSLEMSQTRVNDFLNGIKSYSVEIPVVISSEDTSQPLIETLDSHFLPQLASETQVLEAIRWIIQKKKSIEATILVVDDDPSILEVLRVLLAPWGMLVHTLSDPSQFWSVLDVAHPDLVILDVEMPQYNGIELCELLRNNSRWSQIPVLFLTVHGNKEIVNRIFSAGADDYIQKPLMGPELVTRILNRLERSRLRRRSQPAPSPNLRLEDLSALQSIAPAQENLFPHAIVKLLNIADDAIICVDYHQKIIFFNRGAEKIFGYIASEMMGQSLNRLMPKRYAKAHHQHVHQFGTSERSAQHMGERQEIFGQRKDGTEFPAEASIAKLWQGTDTIYAVILRDLSIRKQEEQHKNNFITVISHEFRTPLTSILGSLEMLTRGLQHNANHETERLLSIAVSSTKRLVELVNRIIEIERIDRGTFDFDFRRVDLADIAREALQNLQHEHEKKGVTIETTLDSAIVYADRNQILKVLVHLLSYSINTSSHGQTIGLKVSLQLDFAQLEVIDRGEGLTRDEIEHVFEKFHPTDLTEPNALRADNLILAFCQSVISQHRGVIWVESEKGTGTHFFVTLPQFSTHSEKY